MSIGRTTQVGVETVPGTAPAGGATKQLTDLTIALDPTFSVSEVRGTGRRFDASVNPTGQESTGGKLGGGLGYNSFVYPASMIWGAATITTPSGGVNARQWQWIPALTGSITPQTMDIEQGDSLDAEQALNAILTDIGVDFTRAAVAPSGTLLAKALNKASAGGPFTGMTTSGVTAIPIVPVLPVQWNAYMDDLATNIGNTQLLRCFHGGLTYSGSYLPFFPLNSSINSFAGVADDAALKTTALIELMKDSVGEGLWAQARAGQKKYIRFEAVSGQLVDNYSTLSTTGSPTSGSATFTYKGQSCAITYNSTNTAAQTAILGLSTVGTGNAVVTGGPWPSTPLKVTMTGALANDSTLPTLTTGTLTPGSVSLTQTTIPYKMTIDFCGEISLPGPMADNSGLRVRQWDFIVVEDPAWSTGQALSVTITNALTAL